jgi:hypothetical protein
MNYCTCTKPASGAARCSNCGAPLCQACAGAVDANGRGPECQPKPGADMRGRIKPAPEKLV